jgi:hypothetical protein
LLSEFRFRRSAFHGFGQRGCTNPSFHVNELTESAIVFCAAVSHLKFSEGAQASPLSIFRSTRISAMDHDSASENRQCNSLGARTPQKMEGLCRTSLEVLSRLGQCPTWSMVDWALAGGMRR